MCEIPLITNDKSRRGFPADLMINKLVASKMWNYISVDVIVYAISVFISGLIIAFLYFDIKTFQRHCISSIRFILTF